MPQNTSSAVMQQRHEADDSLDFFPTPPWATRALMEHVLVPLVGRDRLKDLGCWEPAAGAGDMARPLSEYFGYVMATDIHPHGQIEHSYHDFLMPMLPRGFSGIDWIITNPPFALAEQFIVRAEQLANYGFSMLVRSAFLEGKGRYNRLFSKMRPTIVSQFAERVVMHKGKLSPTGSTATAYCWVTWARPFVPQPLHWIPPCRKQLERASDYSLQPQSDGGLSHGERRLD